MDCCGSRLCGCILYCKQKTAYEMRISDWSSDVCSSDLRQLFQHAEDLHLRNVLRRRRRETADLIALLPERADGVPLARLVPLQIVQTDAARVGDRKRVV